MNRIPHGGYPLGALFVLIAAFSVVLALLAAMGRAVQEGQVAASEASYAAAYGGAAGIITGMFVGLYHYRQPRGLLLGVLAGLIVGVACGPVTLTPASDFVGLLSLSCGGASVLIAIGGAVRRMSRRADNEPVEVFWE